MKYQYTDEWYQGVEYTSKRAAGDTGTKGRAGAKSLTATFASLLLCAAASYISAGIIGTGSLAADVPPASVPSPAEDATYVMSWWFDTDKSTDTEAAETSDEHSEHIRELAEAYIAERTPGVEE